MKQTITLQRVRQMVSVTPPVDCLRSFRTPAFHAVADSEYGVKLTSRPEPLWYKLPNDQVGFTAGLEPLIAEFLRRRGYRVKMETPSFTELESPRRPPRARGLHWDPQLLQFIQQHERGIIRYAPVVDDSGGIDPLVLIRQVVHAWPQLRVLVLCTREQEVRRIANRLPRAEAVLTGRGSGHSAQIAVSTYQQAGMSTVHLDSIDLCLVMDPTECYSLRQTYSTHPLFRGTPVSPPRNDWFSHLSGTARLFGFLPLTTPLAVQQRDQLLMLFGHQTLLLTEHGKHQRRVNVAYARHHHGDARQHENILSIKRNLIWKNPIRNRRLVQLINALREGNRNRIEDHCRGLLMVESELSDARIGLVVDSLDHAFHLSARLPNVPVCTAGSPNMAEWRRRQIDWLQSRRRPVLKTGLFSRRERDYPW